MCVFKISPKCDEYILADPLQHMKNILEVLFILILVISIWFIDIRRAEHTNNHK